MRSPFVIAVIFLLFSLFDQPALAGKRVALVIGNSAYQNVSPLPNPVSDAAAVADMFKTAGFDVVDTRSNLKNVETRRALNSFYDSSRDADIAVIYYAGHGIEIEGSNYIIPVDAVLERDRDVYDEAIPLDRVVQSIEPARQLRLVILDACRENPFSKSMRRTLASRGVSRGLARVDPDTPNTLIAFAAKAGATADDGGGSHSPFTTSLLKHLTVPGLDLRKAFGLVRDEVMNSTGNRQEPFVFGSLGGADVSLVPAPIPATVAPAANAVAEVRADYQLAERVGTKEAWDYFLIAHDSGFYADLARAQRNKLAADVAHDPSAERPAVPSDEKIRPGVETAPVIDQAKLKVANLSDQPSVPARQSQADIKVAAVPPDLITPGREPTSKEALDWDKVKDSADQSALQSFIKRYPNSPLSINAQQRLEVLKHAAEEREAKARAEREAAAKAAEEARIQAEQKKAEIAAAKKREDDERDAKARAEREAAAKAAEDARIQAEQKKAELAAAKKREDDERRAKAAEAEQNAKAAAAEKKAAEAKQKAEEAERTKAAAEAAALRAASEQQAKQAEAERKKAELAAAQEAACKQQQTRFDELSAKGSDGSGTDDMQDFSKTITCDRLRPQVVAMVDKFKSEAVKRAAERKKAELAAAQEATCKEEQTKFDELSAKGSDGSGTDDMQNFSKAVACDRLRPPVVAMLEKFKAEAAKRAAAMPNSPELVRAAQTELVRIGCFSGKIDGLLSTTKSGLERYLATKDPSSGPTPITEALVSELTHQTARSCPLECKAGETAKGEICVATEKPAAPTSASRHSDDDDANDTPARRKPAKHQVSREAARPSHPAPVPQARQQAAARPSGNGNAGGGGHTMVGVGF